MYKASHSFPSSRNSQPPCRRRPRLTTLLHQRPTPLRFHRCRPLDSKTLSLGPQSSSQPPTHQCSSPSRHSYLNSSSSSSRRHPLCQANKTWAARVPSCLRRSNLSSRHHTTQTTRGTTTIRTIIGTISTTIGEATTSTMAAGVVAKEVTTTRVTTTITTARCPTLVVCQASPCLLPNPCRPP